MLENLPGSPIEGVTGQTTLQEDDDQWKANGTYKDFDQEEFLELTAKEYFADSDGTMPADYQTNIAK